MKWKKYVQELSVGPLQTDNEVYENAEYDHRKEGDRQINEREGERFDEWVIHRSPLVAFHNGSMREESRYLSHR